MTVATCQIQLLKQLINNELRILRKKNDISSSVDIATVVEQSKEATEPRAMTKFSPWWVIGPL